MCCGFVKKLVVGSEKVLCMQKVFICCGMKKVLCGQSLEVVNREECVDRPKRKVYDRSLGKQSGGETK